MIEIILFEQKYESQVKSMVQRISHEFETSIFAPSSKLPQKSKIALDKYWLALFDQQVIGTIASIKLNQQDAVLKMMFVRKKFRGTEQGTSKKLLRVLIDWCQSENLSNIYLGTMSQFKAAHKFYLKNGFQKVEKEDLPEDFINNPIDDVFFIKQLDSVNDA